MPTAPFLGVGLLYQPVLEKLLLSEAWPADYLEIIPDTLWHDAGPSAAPRFVVDDTIRRLLEDARARMPILLHGIGLSIGSADELDHEYIEQLRTWAKWLDSPWVSEHLAYGTSTDDAGQVNVGLALPVTLDRASVDQIGPRVRTLREHLELPFLLENNVYYFSTSGEDLTEPELINQLCAEWGASILLDLHNIHVNVRNGMMDAADYLAALDLSSVREIHIAGGMEIDGIYVDAHSGEPPREVWHLLRDVAPRCPNLGAITFELLGSWFDQVGRDGLCRVLDQARGSVGAKASGPL